MIARKSEVIPCSVADDESTEDVDVDAAFWYLPLKLLSRKKTSDVFRF